MPELSRGDSPVFSGLVTIEGSYGLTKPSELINQAVSRFTRRSRMVQSMNPDPEIIAVVGGSKSGKSRVVAELIDVVIPNHPDIQEWERREGRSVAIRKVTYEDALRWVAPNRTYTELEHIQASDKLPDLVEDKIASLSKDNPGFLIFEVPAITEAWIRNKERQDRFYGNRRGGDTLRQLNMRNGRFRSMHFELSTLSVTSNSDVKLVGSLARHHVRSEENDPELDRVVSSEASLGINELRKLKGAPPEIANTEAALHHIPMMDLVDEGIIVLDPPPYDPQDPKVSNVEKDEYTIRCIVGKFLPLILGPGNLALNPARVYCGVNYKFL